MISNLVDRMFALAVESDEVESLAEIVLIARLVEDGEDPTTEEDFIGDCGC